MNGSSGFVDGYAGDVAADVAVLERGVYEIRDLAKAVGASRQRGESKRETAERAIASAPDAFQLRDTGGGVLELELVDPSAGGARECRACGGPMLTHERGGATCVDCDWSQR